MNQCWVTINWILRNRLQWNFNQNTKLFVHENASEKIVCEMVAILSRGRWVKNKANLRDLIAATGLVISNWIQIVNFSTCVTVKFDGWPRKTIGHFFHTTSSFVHHFKSIGDFKLDLQSRNAQSGSELAIFYPVWPWNLMDDLGKQ